MIQGTGVQVSDVAHEPFYFKNWAEFRGAIKFKGIKLFFATYFKHCNYFCFMTKIMSGGPRLFRIDYTF